MVLSIDTNSTAGNENNVSLRIYIYELDIHFLKTTIHLSNNDVELALVEVQCLLCTHSG